MPQGRIPPNPQLVSLPVTAPGSYGLNLQEQNALLPMQWAIEAINCVISQDGHLSARGGQTSVTSTPGATAIKMLFEYRTAAGSSQLIIASNGSLSNSLASPGNNNIGGSVNVANGRWFFANFNSKVIGFQAGKTLISYTGTGTFSSISGSPQGGIGTAAYGRVWAVDADGQTVKWCALLDETNWTTGDSGSVNMAKVWPLGVDTVKAIFAFNGTLVIAGYRQMVFYGSADPTVLGLDVTQLQVVDQIEGTGVISQWTVAAVGTTDAIFVSDIGIQSVQRLLVNRSRPTTQLSKYVRDTLIGQLQAEVTDNVTGFYSPTNGFYAVSFPVSGQTWVADLRRPRQDDDGDQVSRMTRWTIAPTAMIEQFNRNVYIADVTGIVAQYGPGNDYGNLFNVNIRLPWTDFATEEGPLVGARLKALKRLAAIANIRNASTLTYLWYIDFSTNFQQEQFSFGGTTSAEWGIAQWGIDQWSGGLFTQTLTVPGAGTGQYFSFALSALTDSNFDVHQLNLVAKVLRIA